MHAHRAMKPSPRRLVAGLAAAAVTTAGLACMGTAHAADPTGFPRTLDFRVSDQVATGDDVFAAGYVGTGTGVETEFEFIDGYVEAVGAQERVHLGDGSWPTAVAASPDGETLHVIGEQTDEQDPERARTSVSWTIDTDTMTLSEPTTLEGLSAQAIAAGAEGTYVAWTNWDGIGGVNVAGESVELGPNIQPSYLAVMPDVAGDKVIVAGADYSEEQGSGLPTVRTISDGVVSDRVVLGPDGTENRGFILDLDVDEANDLTYVLTARDVDGPQEYGLNVLGDGVDRFIELDEIATSIAVSADGATVYLSGNGIAAYDADALDSYDEDNPAPVTYLDGWAGQLALAPSGRLYVGQDVETSEDPETSRTVTKMLALEAPSAPTNLRAVAAEWSAETLMVSWGAADSAGGVPADDLTYRLTLTDNAGGAPVVEEVWLNEFEFYDLEQGHTYTLSVATTNGAFTSAPVTATYQVLAPVAHPSAIAVRGKLAVGQRLSVANTGSWAPGTTLSYVWGTQNNEDIAHGATLMLNNSHLGRNIWVRVTGTKAGSASTTVYSDLTGKVALGTLTARVPSISGVAKVGKLLTAKPGSWTGGAKLTYRWLANGKAIKGATARTLKLKGAQAGKKITVQVTGTKAGYRTAKKTSKATAQVKR